MVNLSIVLLWIYLLINNCFFFIANQPRQCLRPSSVWTASHTHRVSMSKGLPVGPKWHIWLKRLILVMDQYRHNKLATRQLQGHMAVFWFATSHLSPCVIKRACTRNRLSKTWALSHSPLSHFTVVHCGYSLHTQITGSDWKSLLPCITATERRDRERIYPINTRMASLNGDYV